MIPLEVLHVNFRPHTDGLLEVGGEETHIEQYERATFPPAPNVLEQDNI